MFLARVIGRVVTTQQLPGMLGEKLLIVQPLDEQRAAAGDTLVACDAADSGLGDIVHVCDGREATLALHDSYVPIDATIVGHVEEFAHDGPAPRISAGDVEAPGAPRAGMPGASGASGASRAPAPRPPRAGRATQAESDAAREASRRRGAASEERDERELLP